MTSNVPRVRKTIDDVIICQTTAEITPIGSKRGAKYQGFYSSSKYYETK